MKWLYERENQVINTHRPCMINSILGLKQHTLKVNGHALFHFHGFHRAVRNGKQAENQIENIHWDSNQRPLAFRAEYNYK